jgi:hypothetical protein
VDCEWTQPGSRLVGAVNFARIRSTPPSAPALHTQVPTMTWQRFGEGRRLEESSARQALPSFDRVCANR